MNREKFNYLLNKIKIDSNALEEIYDVYYSRIILYISIRYPKEVAEDIAQEFFLNLLKAKSFKHVENPTSWIYKCCDNLVRQKYNRNDVQCTLCDKFDLLDSKKYDSIVDDTDFIDKISMQEKVERALNYETDKTTKRIIYMYFWLGYNLREIAEILSMKKSTVKQRYSRSLKKMKKFMEQRSQNNDE